MYMRQIIITILLVTYWSTADFGQAAEQEEKAFTIKKIHEEALTNQMAYKWLYYLSEKIGGRLAGSPQSIAAVEFTHQILDTLNTTKVWNQPCEVNYWYRGDKEKFGSSIIRLLAQKILKCWP